MGFAMIAGISTIALVVIIGAVIILRRNKRKGKISGEKRESKDAQINKSGDDKEDFPGDGKGEEDGEAEENGVVSGSDDVVNRESEEEKVRRMEKLKKME